MKRLGRCRFLWCSIGSRNSPNGSQSTDASSATAIALPFDCHGSDRLHGLPLPGQLVSEALQITIGRLDADRAPKKNTGLSGFPKDIWLDVFSVNYFGRFASIVLAGSDHVDRYQQH